MFKTRRRRLIVLLVSIFTITYLTTIMLGKIFVPLIGAGWWLIIAVVLGYLIGHFGMKLFTNWVDGIEPPKMKNEDDFDLKGKS